MLGLKFLLPRKDEQCRHTKLAVINANKGRRFTEDHKKKIGAAQVGSKNHRYGKTNSDDVRKAISLANKNKIVSDETREKMRVATTNRFINTPMSQEARDKIRARMLGVPIAFGENHYAAKLDNDDVIRIRLLKKQGESTKSLSLIFGVSTNQILRIVKGERWKHLLDNGNIPE